jgi:hypothetical protein
MKHARCLDFICIFHQATKKHSTSDITPNMPVVQKTCLESSPGLGENKQVVFFKTKFCSSAALQHAQHCAQSSHAVNVVFSVDVLRKC